MMEQKQNWTWEEIVSISQNYPWEPGFNKVHITLNVETPDGGLILSDNMMSEKQYIVAVGPYVHNYAVGDEVLIDLDRMIISKPNPNNQDEMVGTLKFNAVFDNEGNMFAEIEDRNIRAKRKVNNQLQSHE